MKTLPLPPLELLKELLEVDITSPSGLRWRKYRSHNARSGDVAGWLNKHLNRWQICVNKKKYYCYRIQFFLKTGSDPHGFEIDHVDLNPADPKNIRKSTKSQNAANKKKVLVKNGNHCTSRHKGVDWREEKKRWRARCAMTFLGYFEEEKEAALAYNKAALEYFGEFARLNVIED